MSIRAKLIFIIASLLVVVGSSMSVIIYWQNNSALTNHIHADIRTALDYNSQLINFYISRAENGLTNLANDDSVIGALETNDPQNLSLVSEKITEVNKAIDNIENIGLIEIIGSSCKIKTGDKASLPFIGVDFSSRDYCSGILNTKQTYVSSAYVSAVTKNIVLAVIVPVKSTNGQVIGGVLGTIVLPELRGYLWDLQDNSKVEVLDRYGVMFLNTEKNITKLGDLQDDEKTELEMIKKSLNDHQNEGFFRDGDNFVGFQSSGSFIIVYEKSATSMLSMINNLNYTVLVSLLIAISITILLIYLFIGIITKRLSRLSQLSQEIASGKFQIKLSPRDLKSNDETAVLTRAFSDMAKKLEEIYNNLEQKVKERTKKIADSEKAVKKSLDESERANKLMVGRELEMIKLKQEIVDLRNRYKK